MPTKRIAKAVGKKVELIRRSLSTAEDLEAKRRNENLLKEYTFAIYIFGYQSFAEQFVYSPLSISLGLALLHAGASGTVKEQILTAIFKGSTHEELEKFFSDLAREISRSRNETVFLANHLFMSTGVSAQKPYLEKIMLLHHAGLTQLPLSYDSHGSAICVNSQIGLKTRNHVDKIITEGDLQRDTTLLLANALHFRAEFDFQFGFRSRLPFYSTTYSKRMVDFVGDVFVPRQFSENKEFHVLVLPYTNKKFALHIFLPKKHIGLRAAMSNLCADTMLDLIRDTKEQYLKYRIPLFKIDCRLNQLQGVLSAVGLSNVFEKSSEFAGISQSKFLTTQIVHKVRFEIGENGTYSESLRSSLPKHGHRNLPEAFKFVADHPFFYVVTMDLHPLYIGYYN